mmetsp:Transcript_14357/g.26966  ORF Transcript_14357/g.26966 Transcript_14357/m.26966 type:complete len:106 (+) Transcript_14357:5054-5371(+)
MHARRGFCNSSKAKSRKRRYLLSGNKIHGHSHHNTSFRCFFSFKCSSDSSESRPQLHKEQSPMKKNPLIPMHQNQKQMNIKLNNKLAILTTIRTVVLNSLECVNL